MIRNQTRSTQLGWLLLSVITLLGVLPWAHWALSVTQGVLFVVGAVAVWYVTRRTGMLKRINIDVEGVEADQRAALTQRIKSEFGDQLKVIAPLREAANLTFQLTTTDSLTAVNRRLSKTGLPVGLLKLEGTAHYTTTTASARMQVEVSGVATPNAEVFLPGLKYAVDADARGRFRARLPFDVIHKYASRGYLPATWRKDDVEQEMRVPIPA